MNSYYGSVNGPACHYAKLIRYNKCSLAEIAATPQPSSNDYKFQGTMPGSAAKTEAGVEAGMVSKPAQPVKKPNETFTYSREGFTGFTGFTGDEGSVSVADYTPSYKVPNYPPINTDSLTHGTVCGNYANIISAYGSSAGNCTTNFVNN